MTAWAAIGVAAVVIFAMMQTLWWWQLHTGKAKIVDVGWTLATGGSVVFFAVIGTGDPLIRAVIGGGFALWTVRLAGFLWWTRIRVAQKDDGRYAKLREQWGDNEKRNMWFTFHLQGLLALLLGIAFLPATSFSGVIAQPLLVAAGLIFALALLGSTIVDAQLARFRETYVGGICRTGLWNWCRHPNYFFEIVIWWSLGLASVAGGVWYGLLAAIVMTGLIRFVTGVPPKEAQALRSRGEAYRQYQRETRLLLPLPPRNQSPEQISKHAH
jgi:steroid 5-alpha reductase family enzyme